MSAGGSGVPPSILDRPIPRGKSEVSLSAFSFLMSSVIHYFQERVDDVLELEKSLENLGFGIGVRFLELCSFRDRHSKRELKLLSMLQFVSSTLWRTLFGRPPTRWRRALITMMNT
eukprot:EC795171.1.p2 GENE.EC795171.1~~EC795171.1.p2  ORF type:complete len:127 (+),score=27.63 EC795171.1:36-383(+)